ncbi:hypothetical protein E8K88_15880 [Lampropedia aestuarii]|uniref:Uncharacterized protein n=1 Tax=Lampropedia aestuarii TaxID=2562762 RepID=A0A4S5BKB7_9BURK|nr:hypothetical protein [Lampropedia aestuarii]THJ31121.1 hypothetical protein E8K88_15880 [Lampropedia aestuarii]
MSDDRLVLNDGPDTEAERISKALQEAYEAETKANLERLEQLQAEVEESLRQHAIRPNGFPQPGSPANTTGVIVPQTQPYLGANTEPPITAETDDEKSYLESQKEGLDQSIDDWVERQGFSQSAMVAGAIAKALNEVFFPTDATDIAFSVAGGPVAKVGAKLGQKLGGYTKNRKKGKADDGCPQCL